jgi:hypothetical protein
MAESTPESTPESTAASPIESPPSRPSIEKTPLSPDPFEDLPDEIIEQ